MIVTTLRTHSEYINGTKFHFAALLVMERGVEHGKFHIVAETACKPFCHVVYESEGSTTWCVDQVESVRGDHFPTLTAPKRDWHLLCRAYAAVTCAG